EPLIKRAVAFFDGQNLFYSVRSAFGYTFPNYDVVALATAVCATRGWRAAVSSSPSVVALDPNHARPAQASYLNSGIFFSSSLEAPFSTIFGETSSNCWTGIATR